jgi:hypothetical protein
MTAQRSDFPLVLVSGALLMAATTCLTVSYADINDAPRNMGKATLGNEQPKATGESAAWFGKEEEEEKQEEIENERLPERAEEAREETEEERENQKKSSSEDRPGSAVLRAHLELINSVNPAAGGAFSPCTQSVTLPPVKSRIELRFTKRSVNETEEATRTMHEVTSSEKCGIQGDFYIEPQSAPARITLCPDACAWAKSATNRLSVDVLVTFP